MVSRSDLLPMMTPTSGRVSDMRLFHHRSKIDAMKIHALIVALTLSGPAMAQSARPIELGYTQFTLPNGFHEILHDDHSAPVASVDAWYHLRTPPTASARTGFAHLFRHFMF